MGGGFGPGTDSGRALGGPGRVRGLGGDVVVGGRTVGCGHSGCDGGGLEAFDDQPDAVAVFSAATRYVQNNAGSLSRWSSESHATDRPSAGAAASHSASSVVLPNPAGADTSVSADSAPRLRRSLSLGRATRTASPPGDVELGLEQGACHDHRPSGASLHVPSTKNSLPATQLPATQLPATQRLAPASCQQADRDHLVTWFHRTRNFGRPGWRFPAASTYRSNCTSTDRGEGTVPPRIAPGTARSSTLGVDQPR